MDRDQFRDILRKYVLSGWFVSLGHGAYARAGQPVGWEGVLLGLQRLGGVSCHVGGLSALNRQGAAHFLPLGGEPHIRVMVVRKPPAWVQAIELDPALLFENRHLFADEATETGRTKHTGTRYTIFYTESQTVIKHLLSLESCWLRALA